MDILGFLLPNQIVVVTFYAGSAEFSQSCRGKGRVFKTLLHHINNFVSFTFQWLELTLHGFWEHAPFCWCWFILHKLGPCSIWRTRIWPTRTEVYSISPWYYSDCLGVLVLHSSFILNSFLDILSIYRSSAVPKKVDILEGMHVIG